MLEMKKDTNKTSFDISLHKIPNEIGRVHICINNQQVIPVKSEYVGEAMAKESEINNKRKHKKQSLDSANVDKKAIVPIWKHMGLGHIDISYACIGYSLEGRPILNHDEFVNLLINYGFNIKDIIPFIDDFAKHSLEDPKSPIVMFTANTSAIMTNIKPIA